MTHIKGLEKLLAGTGEIHSAIRDAVLKARQDTPMKLLQEAVSEEEEDTIYRIDKITEKMLIDLTERFLARENRITLIAEGMQELTIGPASARSFKMIVDPIDGTRVLMHDKRPAWILSGLALDRGAETRLDDIFLAMMTEIPTTRQWRADRYWAVKGEKTCGEGVDLIRHGNAIPLSPQPSKAPCLTHGFAQVSRFFPGVKSELAELEEEVFNAVTDETSRGRGHIFEDQYLSSGGQLHELITGKDRFCADLRPLFKKAAKEKGIDNLLCCHPYDISAELVARQAGVIVEKPLGDPLDAPLDTTSDVAWVAYSNKRIKNLLAPALRRALERRGLTEY